MRSTFKRIKNSHFAPLMFGLIVSLFLIPVPANSQETLIFGVVPQQASVKLLRTWTPLLEKMSELSGVNLQFATAPNIPAFESRLAKGEYDIAYMNPYHFTVFNLDPGYRAIAHAKDKKIKGILVVKKDSEVQTLEQLDGAQLAFPAPAAFAATLLTQSALKLQGISFTPNYVGSHDSSYLSVSEDIFSSGGGVLRTLGSAPDAVKNDLRILHTTKGFTPHAVASHPRVKGDIKLKLQQALVSLSSTPEGKEALKALNIKGFQSAKDKDWDDVRNLNISVLR